MSLLSIVIVSIFSLIAGCVIGGLLFSSFHMENVGLVLSSIFFGIVFSIIMTVVFVYMNENRSEITKKMDETPEYLNKEKSGNMTEKKHKVQKDNETKNDKNEENLLKSKWMTSYDDKQFTTEELFLLKEAQEKARTNVYEKALTLEETPSNKNLNSFRNELFKTYDELSK